jgi:hypothetical protein
MNSRLEALMRQIKELEKEVVAETLKKEEQFCYKIHEKSVEFTAEVRIKHQQLRVSIHRFLLNSRWLVVLTAPVIWLCLLPIFLSDVIASFYQAVCFPIYGIPKVRRSAYLAFDRHHLSYLNLIEKLNCEYCAYANGILAYFTEIAARTEQYWCPIKHAECVKCAHSRYKKFADFGDAEDYRKHIEDTRRYYADID